MQSLIWGIRNSGRRAGEGNLRRNGICALVPRLLISAGRPIDIYLEMGSAEDFAYEIDTAEC